MTAQLSQYKGILIRSLVLVTSILFAISIIGSVNLTELVDFWDRILVAFLLVLAIYLIKCIKFVLVCKSFIDDALPYGELFLIRISSEFFSLIGVSYIGDEAFRAVYLNKRHNVGLPMALIMGYLEVFTEVLATVSVALVGIGYLLLCVKVENEVLLGVIVTATLIVASFHGLLAFKIETIKGIIWKLVGFLKKSAKLNELLHNYEEAIKRFLDLTEEELKCALKNKRLLMGLLALTYISTSLSGLVLWIFMRSLNVNVDVFIATTVVCVSLIISSLPISISGSGVLELTLLSSSLLFSRTVTWNLPVLYRVATYYMPIVFTLLLLNVAMKRILK